MFAITWSTLWANEHSKPILQFQPESVQPELYSINTEMNVFTASVNLELEIACVICTSKWIKKWFATMSFLYSTLQAFYSLTIFSSFLISRISVLFMLSICAEFEIHSLFSPPYGWNMVLYEMWAELKEIPQRRQVWLELSCSMMLRVDQPLVPQETSIKAECSKWLVVERV